jgi:uncharacterized protein (DUF1330 family)
MAAYLIADLEIIDPVAYADYRERVPAVIAAHGGKYLARGGAVEALEGAWTPHRSVIVEFPSMDALKAFYRSPEYQPLIAIRQQAAKSNLIALEGV